MNKKMQLGQQALALQARILELAQSDLYREALRNLQHDDGPWDYLVGQRIWELLMSRPEDLQGVCLVRGTMGLGCMAHIWYELSLSPEESGERDFRFIVDPCVPDCNPNVLVISPRSPLKQLYKR